MNYSIFNIEERLVQLLNNSVVEYNLKSIGKKKGLSIFEFDKNIEKEVEYIISKSSQCYKLIENIQNNANEKIKKELEITALSIEYSQEIKKIIEKYTNDIIGPVEDIDIGDITIFRGFEKLKHSMFIELKKLLDYFLEVNKEIYNLVKTSSYYGVFARYRVQIEIYCIFLFFTKYPEYINRFSDHQVIKKYFIEKKNKILTEQTVGKYNEILNKYNKNELRNCKLNYWWAGDKIKNHKSIKEIISIALDNEDTIKYFSEEYNLLSEYSHVSSYVINLDKINLNYIGKLLFRSVDMNFYIMQLYTGWLLDKTQYQDSTISYIINIYKKLRKIICNVKEPEKTLTELLELYKK
jgi:hypothetical protein